MVWFLFSSNFKTITNPWRFRTINLRLINGEVKTYSFLYSISRFGQVTHPNRLVKLTVPVIKAVGLSEDKNSFPQTALMRGCVENISCVSKREFFRHLKNKQRWTSSQNFAEVSHRPRVSRQCVQFGLCFSLKTFYFHNGFYSIETILIVVDKFWCTCAFVDLCIYIGLWSIDL